MDRAVRFEVVCKEYPFYQPMNAGFKSFLFNLPKNIASLRKGKFVALKDVSFDVNKGETFGIIGRNGSGKSTILGLVAGVMKPDRGIVRTNGKISSLLELGAGFHPDLSGVENIILNGILAGNTKEDMLKKLEMIIDFSELGEFVYQPLRTYSSGMQMRLGFSVAVHIDPEILLIDEALSVGDVSFQEKCQEKMIEFKKNGATILIVSHDMPAVAKLCDRAAWIDNGKVIEIGEPGEVIRKYLDHFGQKIPVDVEEERSLGEAATTETETQPPAGGSVVLEDVRDISVPISEAAVHQDTETPVHPLSWWDYPSIIHYCGKLITGNPDKPDTYFYEFLKTEYGIDYLEKGLCICRRLHGIEKNFVLFNNCKSFDVISEPGEIVRLLSATRDFRRTYYDLVLCIDLLSHIDKLDAFLEKLGNALKTNGVIIALEYVGSPLYHRPHKALELAGVFCRAIGNGDMGCDSGISDSSAVLRSLPDNGADAVNSDNVIPALGRLFDIVDIRYFGGPFYDLVLNKIIDGLDPISEQDAALIRVIIQCEQILIKENILENDYAMIVAKKKDGSE